MKKAFLALIFPLLSFGVFAQNGADLDNTFGEGGVVRTIIGDDDAKAYGMAIQQDGKIVLSGEVILDSFKYGLARYNTNGSLDNNFGAQGVVTTTIGKNSFAKDVAIQEDGKIVQAGYIFVNGSYHAVAVRYLENGEMDAEFGENGIAHLPALNNCMSVAIQSDGKIVLGGYKSDNFGLGRLNSDGTIDTSYGENGYVMTQIQDLYGEASTSYISAIGAQKDDKIVAVGFLYSYNTYNDIAIVRYNTDGSLDAEFGNQGVVVSNIGGLSDFGTAVTFQEDGKIIVGGHKENGFLPGIPEYDAVIIRLNAEDGSFDTTFGEDGAAIIHLTEEATYVNDVAVQADGKIVITGAYVIYSEQKFDMYVARLNADGSIDTEFGDGGSRIFAFAVTENAPQKIAVQEDGKIVIGGFLMEDNLCKFMVFRLMGDATSTDIPAVEVTFDNITTTSLDATMTPNALCESYYFVLMTAADMQMWAPFMGGPEAAIKQFGIHESGVFTHHFNDLTPNTEYFVYTISVGYDGFEAPYDSTMVQTAILGGNGVATATIELTEITETTVRMIVTPNSETAVYHDGLITKEYFDEIGEEAAIELIRNNGYPQYGIDNWVWTDLEMSTIYKAIATCQNALGEWGPATIVEFSTLPLVGINDIDTKAVIIFPNPGNGRFEVAGDGLSGTGIRVVDMAGKVVYSAKIGDNHILVDISNCNNGLYIVEIEKDGEISTAKFVKQ